MSFVAMLQGFSHMLSGNSNVGTTMLDKRLPDMPQPSCHSAHALVLNAETQTQSVYTICPWSF